MRESATYRVPSLGKASERGALSGIAPNCTATLTPIADANGVSNIDITVSDGSLSNLQSFTATYNAVNDGPLISAIGNQTMTQDTSLGVNFTITDVDTAITCAGSMSATSSNVGLIPVANIVFTGVAPNCTVTFTPVLLQNGVSNISVSFHSRPVLLAKAPISL